MVQLSHLYMTTGKPIALTKLPFVSKVTSLLFNTASMFVMVFFLRSKSLLIPWLQSQSTVILEARKIKIHCFHIPPFICHEVMEPGAIILVFQMLSFKPAFSFSSFNFIKRLFSSSSLSAIRVASSVSEVVISPGNLDSSL